MTDLTPILNELLKSHDAPPTANPSLALQNIDQFLKEAYRINSHIASLNSYLRNIRQSYLSKAPPLRRTNTSLKDNQWQYLTDRQREEIDAETKQLLRELNASIRAHADAEQLRQDTVKRLIEDKYDRLGLGALGSWATGGTGSRKSIEQELDEAKANTIAMHRENVLWYLRQKLQECGGAQASMMEKRLMRQVEKNRSLLANSRIEHPELGGFVDMPMPLSSYQSSVSGHLESHPFDPAEELTAEQIQIFEKDNQDMLKHFESTLDQVRTAEKSLVEISELQSQLVNNLAVQSEHIDLLVADSSVTAENIGGDLGIGAYRDDNAKPWVLPVVKKADQILHDDPSLNHEYLPIAGLATYTSAAANLMLGADSPAIAEKRTASIQTISGTGALHLGALFLSKFYPTKSTVYFSNPTWANHNQIFSNVAIPTATYPYFSKSTKGLDFTGMKKAISDAPEHSIILLHVCAHNPTGVDPTQEQWKELAVLLKQKSHFPFFDCAYQGFASGDLARDAWAVRYFVEQGFELCIAESFAKNFGLYGERAGCFHFVTGPSTDAQKTIGRIASQLAILQRSEISNPPAYGARIAGLILNDEALFKEWEENLKTMSGRIISMRKALRSKLEELGTPGTWNHITDQIGMFSFTGLSEKQVLQLRDVAHVYMTKNGRISMAGLNTGNVGYFAEAVDKVIRETK
ncbi:hypothetical protein B7494_g6660 [Chlorociboria aeruginascens]|nr:hypothetical protein B7494_g6660 [Chlorociboria aeruginascens]